MALPQDLLRPIVRHISHRGSLIALLYSSRVLRDEAERIIYSTFQSRYQQEGQGDPYWVELPLWRQQGFFQRVESSPQVASYVKRMNLEVYEHLEDPLLESFLHTLNRALPTMRNLEVLAFLSNDLPGFAQLLAMHSTRFQLKILDWNCPLEPSDEQFVQVFLRSQRQLERVILTSWNSKDPMSMPGLRNVWAHSTPAAMALVTGNSVRTLRWNPDLFAHTLPAAFPPSFLESFRGITTLTIGHHPDLFPTLVEYLDNVRILEICGSQERQPDIGKLVHRVPHLEELTLTSIPTPTVDKALIKDIFRRGRKLRTIYVRPDTVRCTRWDRTAEEGIPAPNHNFYSHLPWRNCGLDEVDFPWEEIEKSR